MNKTITCLVIFLLMALISPAVAQQPVTVHHAWVRPAPPVAKMLAAYMTIKNDSTETRELIKVTSGLFEKVEIHLAELHEGMRRMIRQEKLSVPAGGSLKLEPGGYHLMLIGPKAVPKEGEEVLMELHFDNGQVLNLKVPVRPGADTGGMMEEHGHH